MNQDLHPYFRFMVNHDGSDLFLSPGAPATLKVDGVAKPMTDHAMEAPQVQQLAYSVLTPDEIQRFEHDLELNKALDIPEIGRFRLNLYRQRGMTAFVARHIKNEIPSIRELGMPPLLEKLVMEERGLVLITGAAGAGKSTTLAAMIDFRNQNRPGHILLIEDPIEYIHSHKKAIVDQREIGIDTMTFDSALRNAMREAPDVIVIGEIRDLETMKHAISYAETGHLCLATLHASNAHQALERILNFFDLEHHPQILLDLSLHLKAIVSQRLVRGSDGKRIPAAEIMLNTPFVTELIQSGRIDEIGSAISMHTEAGSCSFDHSLFRLWKEGKITREEALTYADSKANLSVMIRLDASPEHTSLDNVGLQGDDDLP